MYICYVDESGTPETPGTSSHFILCGIAIPVEDWREADRAITKALVPFGLEDKELHTAWMARRYIEQSRVPDFESLLYSERKSKVRSLRTKELLRLQKTGNAKQLRQVKKNYRKTEDYVHLSEMERLAAIASVADTVSGWPRARLFAECIDKTHFDPVWAKMTAEEQAFEQVISRFQHFLSAPKSGPGKTAGMIVHDNNESVASKHTELMRKFFETGTLWTKIDSIVETPLFVDSSLTRMVQVADLCAYALRRYLENGETQLFRKIFGRADRLANGKTVGIRHFCDKTCTCEICRTH